MAKKSKPKIPAKSAKTPQANAGLRRRSRMIALEPRMLFDGALGVDLGAKGTAALRGDTSFDTADSPTPAAPEAQRTDTQAAEKPAEKVADKPVEALAARPGAEPKELVFVDTSVLGYQDLLKNVNPDATVVLLDASRDAFDQMADYMDGQANVSAVHVISHGSAGNIILGGQTYSADRLTSEYQADLARIGRAMSAEGDILLYG